MRYISRKKMTVEQFEHIATGLRPQLLRVGYDFFGNNEKAEDVAQEVLMRLYVNLDDIEEDYILPMAIRMAKNYCVSEWRREKRFVALSCREPQAEAATDASATISEREKTERLDKAMKKLTPTEQHLIAMRYEEEKSIDSISKSMNINPQSVSVMISRARKKLKSFWKKGERYER